MKDSSESGFTARRIILHPSFIVEFSSLESTLEIRFLLDFSQLALSRSLGATVPYPLLRLAS